MNQFPICPDCGRPFDPKTGQPVGQAGMVGQGIQHTAGSVPNRSPMKVRLGWKSGAIAVSPALRQTVLWQSVPSHPISVLWRISGADPTVCPGYMGMCKQGSLLDLFSLCLTGNQSPPASDLAGVKDRLRAKWPNPLDAVNDLARATGDQYGYVVNDPIGSIAEVLSFSDNTDWFRSQVSMAGLG